MKKLLTMFMVVMMLALNGPMVAFAAWTEQANKTNPDTGDADNSFGSGVAIDGDYAMVGATHQDDGGGIYAYKRSGTSWNQEDGNANCAGTNDCIKSSDLATGDVLGQAIAISGNYAIAGANLNDDSFDASGSAYIFTTADGGDTWSQQDKLSAPTPSIYAYFGWDVDISGDYAIVGSPGEANGGTANQGGVYFFKRNGSSWDYKTKVVSPDAGDNEDFGISVGIDGNYAVVGSPADEDTGTDTGIVYVYSTADSGESWTLDATIWPTGVSTDDDFGAAVDISGDYIAVGAPDTGALYVGAAYVFYNGEGGTAGWDDDDTDLQDPMTAYDGGNFNFFGNAIEINGDDLIVGAYNAAGASSGEGAAYIYTRSGTDWETDVEKVYDTNGAAFDSFGNDVAIDGSYSMAGTAPGSVGEAFFYYDAPASGGVPEFSDYMYMLTILIAIGLMVKVVPKVSVPTRPA